MPYVITLLLALLCGCSGRMLEVRSQYLHPDLLASERVNTPDPCRGCYVGQEVIVRWLLPPCRPYGDVRLVATFRYGTRECEEVVVPLEKSWGFWTYRLLNQDYWLKGGIIAYKVELYDGEEMLSCWKHHVWAEIINID